MISRLERYFFSSVDAAGLACFRMSMGIALFWHLHKLHPVVSELFPDNKSFAFPYELTPFITPMSASAMNVVFVVTILATVMVTLGLLYRVACGVVFAGFTFIFFCDQSLWNNHFYFVSLLLALMCFCHCDRAWAVRKRDGISPSVERWQYWVLGFVVSIVYFYGGVSKLNPDWLEHEPMRRMIANFVADSSANLQWMLKPGVVAAFSYGGLIFDLLIAPLLWWRRTRRLGLVLMTVFHVTNSLMYEIGIFPPLIWAASLFLFCDPAMPRRALRKLLVMLNLVEGTQDKDLGRDISSNKAGGDAGGRRRRIVVAVGVFCLVQLLLPFRYWFYDGHVDWTYYGKPFAWRMMIMDKDGYAEFYLLDLDNGRIGPIDPAEYVPGYRMTRDYGLLRNPNCQASLARHVRSTIDTKQLKNFEIRVLSVASLNGRPYQLLVSPRVDLSTVEIPLWETPSWIVPLAPNQKIGQYKSGEERSAEIEKVLKPQRQALIDEVQSLSRKQ